jgi:peptidoglycan/xylan/chitin deacetylase (PgdA/CDA1 family)
VVVIVQPVAIFSFLEAVSPQIVWRVETAEPLVGLSFDDGPVPENTVQVLEILARHRARATFFLIGNRARQHPSVVDQIRRCGHEIGNHYLTTSSALRDSRSEFLSKLVETERILGLSGDEKLFRPPGGLLWPGQVGELHRQGYRCVLGSAYPYDPRHPPVAYMQWLVAKNLRAGSIVILHDGIDDPSRTIAALDGILEVGRRRGFRFTGVGELLSSRRKNLGGGSKGSSVALPGVALAHE